MGILKKTAVMYGAGNIGRGFIGQLFHDSGYEVIFVDVNLEVLSALNEWHAYEQLIIDGETVERREITGVRAVDGRDKEGRSPGDRGLRGHGRVGRRSHSATYCATPRNGAGASGDAAQCSGVRESGPWALNFTRLCGGTFD